MTRECVNVLGVGVDPVNIPEVIATVGSWITSGAREYVTVTGVHGVMESQRSEEVRRVHAASGLTVPDGMPLVWLSWLAGHRDADRCYGPDLMLALTEVAAREGWGSYYYGGADGVADELRDRLVARHPALRVVGTHCPPFRELTAEETDAVVEEINASGADIVWVGLSTPKQERWMAAHRDRLEAPVLIGVGAAFDFHAGRVRQAPRWIQRSGMEWAYRVAQEPRRLWRRYAVNNPSFLVLMALQALGLRRRELDG